MENIVPFVLIGLLYVSTSPSLLVAKLFFAIFMVTRIAHTIIYLNAVPQPARGLVFLAGFLINCAMVMSVIVHFKLSP